MKKIIIVAVPLALLLAQMIIIIQIFTYLESIFTESQAFLGMLFLALWAGASFTAFLAYDYLERKLK